ncbi:MAG: hypothetical protein IKP71_08135 [Candidatus Riflebacteria bacterium]|nr:hypothetical protein [Candidatus Riflebacteria bacterium]
MNEKTKKILFIIGTTLFIISLFFLEARMIIESVKAYFYGTTGGIRFFGDQTPYYGFEGVKRVLEGWGFGMLIWYSPVMLFQVIYLFFILKEKYNSLKNNEGEKKPEKALTTILILWLAIVATITIVASYFDMLTSIIFNPKIPIILPLLILAEVSILIYQVMTEFIVVIAIITGIVFVFAISIDNWALMIIYLLGYFFAFTLAFVIIDMKKKRRENRN